MNKDHPCRALNGPDVTQLWYGSGVPWSGCYTLRSA